MLPAVSVSRHSCAESARLSAYRSLLDEALLEELRGLGRKLSGLRLCHVNATAAGGGVAELLFRCIPMYRALGLEVDWRIIHGDAEFFRVTKSFHNALQGAPLRVTDEVKREYLAHNETAAAELSNDYDVVVVHDPQPAALRALKPDPRGKWVWRCHIDSSSPSPEAWAFLRGYVERYDAAVFTLESFRPKDLQMDRVAFIAPAIDPFGTKNMELPGDLYRKVIADSGVDLTRPLIVQVSRFDPWKDPLGVLAAFREARRAKPGIQLAFLGAMAGDDPEGWEILHLMQEETRDEDDVHILTNLTGVGSMEVNAFQRGADIVVQKSLREGFGLVVSEALWKSRPVVAGRAGGIPLQFPLGYDRCLVSSVDECARQLVHLLDNPSEAAELGRAGRERVRREFLLPRLVRDELRLLASLAG